jgi:catechol-2,3-dioxygenase
VVSGDVSAEETVEVVMARKKRRPRTLVDDVAAILLISGDAKRLCEFYRATLRLPFKEELHDGMPLHYGCDLGEVHVAIHPASGGWPGVPTRNARSPIINFSTSNLKAVARRLAARGVKARGPTDHGFAWVLSFRDPDGNAVSILEYARPNPEDRHGV